MGAWGKETPQPAECAGCRALSSEVEYLRRLVSDRDEVVEKLREEVLALAAAQNQLHLENIRALRARNAMALRGPQGQEEEHRFETPASSGPFEDALVADGHMRVREEMVVPGPPKD
jgi:hypothetical protein